MEQEKEHQTISVRPAKPVSAVAVVALSFMFLFGIGFAFLVGNVLLENEAPLGLTFVFGVFIIGWLALTLFMLIYQVRNLRQPNGVPFFEVDIPTQPSQKTKELRASPHSRGQDDSG